MPGLDKKGPQNQGPMTGGRRGVCACDDIKEQEETIAGRGRGMGRKMVHGIAICGGRAINKGLGNGAGRGAGRKFRR